MNKVVRLQVPVKGSAGDANIHRQYAIQDASWIWHPDAVAGKIFYGFGDTFLPEGGAEREYRSPWLRSGRFIRISIRTAAEPLILENIRIRETGHPLAGEGLFSCTDPGLNGVIPLMTRVMRMCSHEIIWIVPTTSS